MSTAEEYNIGILLTYSVIATFRNDLFSLKKFFLFLFVLYYVMSKNPFKLAVCKHIFLVKEEENIGKK